MDLSAKIGVVIFGVFFGTVLFSRVTLWIGVCADLWLERHSWQLVIAISPFHSGPWLLVVLATIIYYQHGEPWAPWFFSGIGAVFVLLSPSIAIAYASHRRARRESQNAA